MRVVGSLTTIPGRYSKLLRTLTSLNAQTYPLDAIYLGIPKKSRRLGKSYDEIPDAIKKLCTVVDCDIDYGPCTKIFGALVSESKPDTIIITFDDDISYAPTLVSDLFEYHTKFPNMAIGSSGILLKYGFPFYSTVSNCFGNWNNMTGFELSENGRSVDALCGFSGVLYIRKFFPVKERLYEDFLKYTLMDEDVYFNDDIMISAFLSKAGIDRKVFPNIPVTNNGIKYDYNIDRLDGNEISFNKIEFLQRFRRSINKVKEWGFFSKTQHVTFNETIPGHIIYIITLFIILIAIIYYILIYNNLYPISTLVNYLSQ